MQTTKDDLSCEQIVHDKDQKKISSINDDPAFVEDERKMIISHLKRIEELSLLIKEKIGRNVTLMEICGGHTRVIMGYGIRDILPKNINLISGPGCPVCVSGQYDIDCMLELASKSIPVATYGDMMKVPGSRYSLSDIKSKGGKIFEVYSTTEVLKLKQDYPDIVFFGVGFETTTPMAAFLLKNGVCVYSVHKLVVPALKALITGEVKIDGFINPGHVSTIIGSKSYEEVKMPQVIAGFTPERIIRSILVLLELIYEEKNVVINGYPEAVTPEGNITAQKLVAEQLFVSDSDWRGLGVIPLSGMEVKNDLLNAKKKYSAIIAEVPPPRKTGCKCGDVLQGKIRPHQCPLFKKVCTPDNPHGGCMVSEEGSCSIAYRFS